MVNEAAQIEPPRLGEPYLLTPGPLTTSYAVKQEMLRDWGSRDSEFRDMTEQLRDGLLDMLGDARTGYDCVPIQGSGSFAVEAMLGSLIPREGKVLVLINGAYGKRIAAMLDYLGRDYVVIDTGNYEPPRGPAVTEALAADPAITDVIVVHCETSTGILNPIAEISRAVYDADRRLFIDSMSAFGAIPLNGVRFEALVSSANKCIEGVPGFGYVIARIDALKSAKGRSHSMCLDVHAQWQGFEKTRQWRFTPPTHVIAAFLQALKAHRLEGGVAGRGARYTRNRDVLVAGMRELGFYTLLDDRWQSPIIVTFFSPADPAFSFQRFYELMQAKGFVIYPGKLTEADSFRLGCIGQIDEHVMKNVIKAAAGALREMGITDASASPAILQERADMAV